MLRKLIELAWQIMEGDVESEAWLARRACLSPVELRSFCHG